MRVLIADDCPDTRRVYSKLLEMHGYRPQAVEDGHCAVQAAMAVEPFDVILMDIQMPRCDGVQATKQLRERGYKGIIYAFTATVRSTLKLDGFDDCVNKPTSQEQVAGFLKKLSGAIADKGDIPAAKDSGSSPDPK